MHRVKALVEERLTTEPTYKHRGDRLTVCMCTIKSTTSYGILVVLVGRGSACARVQLAVSGSLWHMAIICGKDGLLGLSGPTFVERRPPPLRRELRLHYLFQNHAFFAMLMWNMLFKMLCPTSVNTWLTPARGQRRRAVSVC